MAPIEFPDLPPDDRAEGPADLPHLPQVPERQGGDVRTHYYPLKRDRLYSLRDAAVILKVDERRLRREILLNDLPALDVPDDRQYLLSGSTLLSFVRMVRPGEDARVEPDDDRLQVLAFYFVLPLLSLALLAWATWGSGGRVAHGSRPLPAPSPWRTNGTRDSAPTSKVILPTAPLHSELVPSGLKIDRDPDPVPGPMPVEASPLPLWSVGPR